MGVIISWGHTIYRQFELLAGKSAPYDFLKLITYKAMTFSDTIEKVDTIRAYHVSIIILLNSSHMNADLLNIILNIRVVPNIL